MPTKVLVVIEENHSLAEMRAGMPFLAALSDRYGYATDWHALTHPSEPNYLAIVGGSTFGITDDHPPAENSAMVGNAPSVFSQAREAGRTAATYAQSMPAPCSTRRRLPLRGPPQPLDLLRRRPRGLRGTRREHARRSSPTHGTTGCRTSAC